MIGRGYTIMLDFTSVVLFVSLQSYCYAVGFSLTHPLFCYFAGWYSGGYYYARRLMKAKHNAYKVMFILEGCTKLQAGGDCIVIKLVFLLRALAWTSLTG